MSLWTKNVMTWLGFYNSLPYRHRNFVPTLIIFPCWCTSGHPVYLVVEIECGWASFGNSFTYLESRLLQSSSWPLCTGALCSNSGPFCSAVIFSTESVKLTKIIMVLFGEKKNSCNTFALTVGWNHEQWVIIPNSQKSVLWEVKRIYWFLRLTPPCPDYVPYFSDFGSVFEFSVLEFHLDSRLNLDFQDSRQCNVRILYWINVNKINK